MLINLYYSRANKAVAETKPHYSPQSGVSDFATLVDRTRKKGGKKKFLLGRWDVAMTLSGKRSPVVWDLVRNQKHPKTTLAPLCLWLGCNVLRLPSRPFVPQALSLMAHMNEAARMPAKHRHCTSTLTIRVSSPSWHRHQHFTYLKTLFFFF